METLQTYQFKDMKITWLRGVDKLTDAGTLFGPVPKAIWSRYTPATDDNMLCEYTDPILIQYKGENYLIDASFDTAKLPDKAKKNLGILTESRIDESLTQLGLAPEDISHIFMSHMHHDHSGGLTRLDENGNYISRFPNAIIHVNEKEWEDMKNPTARTRGTYLKENWEPISHQVETFGDEYNFSPEISMHHTGGHSRGHSILVLKQEEETLVYMADLMLSHAHRNPLWVTGVDDYPMDSIAQKEKWLNKGFKEGYRFMFYHDQFYAVVQFDETGQYLKDYLPRSREPRVQFTEKQDKRIRELN
ncbi:MAG: MBL fold metallo-hydrolase [Gemella sp.]|nr:MBL fold metallo-hydrolase [Gemella sp.]